MLRKIYNVQIDNVIRGNKKMQSRQQEDVIMKRVEDDDAGTLVGRDNSPHAPRPGSRDGVWAFVSVAQ